MSNKSVISFSEIGLFTSYFLAIWLLPLDWLNGAWGVMALAIAGKINPYLSPYSIAFAENPSYFIHCHVLATIFFIPWGFILIAKRNGGMIGWQGVLANHIGEGHSIFFYWLRASALLIPLTYGMLWLVGYPFGSAAHAMWVSKVGIPISALFVAYLISLYLGLSYTLARIFLINSYGGKK